MNKQRKAIRSLLAFSALFLSTHAFAETATLTVTISDLKTNQGSVLIAGYQDEKSFQSFSNWAFSAEQAVDSDSMTFTFDVEVGEKYAITVMQDLNGNKRFDMTPDGRPGEPYGYSNDSAYMGPPTFEAASILIDGDTTASIKMF